MAIAQHAALAMQAMQIALNVHPLIMDRCSAAAATFAQITAQMASQMHSHHVPLTARI